MVSAEKNVAVKLEGGLGNQLFQLAAGYRLAENLNVNLEIDQYGIPLSDVRGKKTIGFDEIDFSTGLGKVEIIINDRVMSRLSQRLAKKYFLMKRILLSLHMRRSKPISLPVFIENEDRDYFALNSSVKLHGNFQSWEIVEQAAKLGFPKILNLKSTKPQVIDTIMSLQTYDCVGLHLRLGEDARNNIGYSQPGLNYYREAINLLAKLGLDTDKILIFSDEIELAKKFILNGLDIKNPIFMKSETFSPAENLFIMSTVVSLICANSTYSSWAGWSVGNKGGRVIVPVPFSDNHHMGSRKFPTSWIRLNKQADWRVE